MNIHTYEEKSRISSSDLTLMGIVAALYAAVTLVLSAISLGVIQLRLSCLITFPRCGFLMFQSVGLQPLSYELYPDWQ